MGQGAENGMGGGRGGRGRGAGGGPPTEAFVSELDAALQLTADQKTKITAIIDASKPRLRELQEDSTKRFIAEQDAMTAEITKVLTPDQAKKLAELRSKPRGGPFGFRNRGPRGL